MKLCILYFCLTQACLAAFHKLTGLEDANDEQRERDWNRFISKDRLQIVDLTNLVDIEKHCPFEADGTFQSCSEPLSTIKIMKSYDQSDLQPWLMPSSAYIGDNLTQPEYSRPFAPHLVAIRDSFLSPWGYIFDFKRWFVHGGCSDKSYYSPNFDYDLRIKAVARFNEPILSLIHPYPGLYFHEFIEIHALLIMSQPLIKLIPDITIIISKRFQQRHLFPLLEILGIKHQKYNFLALKSYNKPNKRNANLLKSAGSLIYSPYIITPLSLYCHYISRSVANQMRSAYSKLPYWDPPGEDIVIFDRHNLRPKRSLPQGPEIFHILNRTYGHATNVRMFYGNESLEETVRIFRGCKVFIAAHGGGESNMMFMPTGGSIIEIRPEDWPITCFIDLANNINMNHFMYIDQDLEKKRDPEMHIDFNLFFPWVNSIINNALKVNCTIILPNSDIIKYLEI